MAQQEQPEETYLTRKQAAYYLQTRGVRANAGTLAMWAVRGTGPPHYKDGVRTVYTQADLEEFRKKRLRRVE